MLSTQDLTFVANALDQFDVLAITHIPGFVILTNIGVFLLLCTWTFTILSVGGVGGRFKPLLASAAIAPAVFSAARGLFKENMNMRKHIFFPFLGVVLGFVLLGNLLGLVPYSATVTSFIAVTLFFSGTGFVANILIGLYVHRYNFFGLFIPAGTPTVLKPALVVIEFVSYLARLFSLAIRLFANMMAGHALLKILSGFAWAFLLGFTAKGVAAVAALAIVWAVTVLELLIAFLQAYVFVVLTSIYLNEAINLH